MPAQRKYPEELRAVKMVFEVRDLEGKSRGVRWRSLGVGGLRVVRKVCQAAGG